MSKFKIVYGGGRRIGMTLRARAARKAEETAQLEKVIADFMVSEGRFELDPDDGHLWCSDSNAGFRPSDLVDALKEAGFEITKACNHQWEACPVNEAGERIRVSGHNLGIYASGVFCVHCGARPHDRTRAAD